MKNLLILTLEFYDRHGVKRKASHIHIVAVTLTHAAEYWFDWACDALSTKHGVMWDLEWSVIEWSLTPCGTRHVRHR